jgi:nucleotide-binding universal stress UspA family protein
MERIPTIKKILVPVDGGLQSMVAQELTASLAKKLKSKVTAIYVVSHELMRPGMQESYPEMYEYRPTGVTGTEVSVARNVPSPARAPRVPKSIAQEITNWHHQKGEEVIGNAIVMFKQEGIKIEPRVVEHADPAKTILKEAKKGNFDLIIMGQSGEAKEEAHLGSVAEKVTHHSDTPVLTVRDKRKISKILVPIDGSERAKRALGYARMIAKNTDAEITLLHVQEPSTFGFRPEEAKKIGSNILSKAANQAKEEKVTQKLELGDPAEKIIETADKGDYDLVVMGSRGYGDIRGFLLGSVSNHVLHYAKHSVLIVR